MFGGAADAPAAHAAADRAVAAGRAAAPRVRGGRLLPVRPSARRVRAALKQMRVQTWAEFSAAVKPARPPGRLAGTVISRRSAAPGPATRWASSGLSDPTGQYEAVLFSEGLAQYRDCWSPAPPCCCSSARNCRARTCARACCMPSRSMTPRPRPEGPAHLPARHQAAGFHRAPPQHAGDRHANGGVRARLRPNRRRPAGARRRRLAGA